MSKSSKIIVGGCSFTDKDYSIKANPPINPFLSWPEVLAEQTGKEVINTAKSGSGNRRIYQKVLNEIFKHDNIEHVIVGWSEWTRQDFLVKNGWGEDGWHTVVPRVRDAKDAITKTNVVDEDVLFDFYMDAFNFDYPTPSQIVNENLNQFYSLQCICKERNIKLKMFQMLLPVNSFFKVQTEEDMKQGRNIEKARMYNATFVKSVLSHPLLLEMDDTFWGWPVFEDIGGIDVLRYLTKRDLWEPISHIDKHPNKKTHENIAKLIQENL